MLETAYGRVYGVGLVRKGGEYVERVLVVETHSGRYLGLVFALCAVRSALSGTYQNYIQAVKHSV
jgi:hypothetical protein